MLYHELQTLSFRCLKLGPLREVLYEFLDKQLISSCLQFALVIKQAEHTTVLQQQQTHTVARQF